MVESQLITYIKTDWVLRILSAVILFQTLFFKFTGAPEAVAIFTSLGVEPWGRIFMGIVELITAFLLLIPSMVIYGAILGIFLMIGAIFSHFFVLGISSAGDGGTLFILAWVVLLSSAGIIYLRRNTRFVRLLR